ncbi:HPP family protein [Streptomyces purpureus]|uniref:HPP family protein n=1 Tax=Streptomyces purpureus TaxID=1951 RepID=UPI002457BF46|nr:HPP family protein [Streptomyces purpureus]
MMLARTPHSPAAATAVIVALQDPPLWSFLGLLALACALLVAAGVAGSRATGRAYPTYWWQPRGKPHRPSALSVAALSLCPWSRS